MELSLLRLFGSNAIQTSTSLIIIKADLAKLTPHENNHGESLLAAIILNAKQQFIGDVTSETGITITSETGEAITYDNSDYYDHLNVEEWKTLVVDRKIKHTFLFNELELYAD